MKRITLYIGIAALVVMSCSTQEKDFQTPQQGDVEFYASFEQPAKEGTRVYANEDLLLRWTADDRVSIFNKNTYNQEYQFIGETGDYEGGFNKVSDPEFITGDAIPHIVSVYPYQRLTRVSVEEVVTVTLPPEQSYAQNSFGLGANTMVSVSSDNLLKYRNVGGYLMLKLYGRGASVSSVTLRGNNGEKLAGDATITMPLEGVPSAVMAEDATTEITLICPESIALGATAEESTQFWFVVPPVTFSEGFTITVGLSTGRFFKKSTTKSVTIERNNLSKMSPIQVEVSNEKNSIIYTSSDGKVVNPFYTGGFGATIISNEYKDGYGIITFDGDVTSIGDWAFHNCKSLTSITIPDSVTSIEPCAFYGCTSLKSITIPNGVTSIGERAFYYCPSLTSITIPNGVTSIGEEVFYSCTSLTSITIPNSVTSFEEGAFLMCTSLTSITIPDSVASIGMGAFEKCKSLTSITIPDSVTNIGGGAFYNCSGLLSIIVHSDTPPTGGWAMFDDTNNCPIYVPGGSVEDYKAAECWSEYADRIQAISSPFVPVPEAVDLGLSVKWASFNLGASKPEEYGDYYAWGETEPYYSSLEPLVWKEGKDAGYDWPSYKWCKGSNKSMTKYCDDLSYGYNGFTDTKTVLDPEDDAAIVNLGTSWRMPTGVEWTELRENSTWTWTTQNGVNGYLVTASNGNSIFLPAAGRGNGTHLYSVGSLGYYWSSSLYTGFPGNAWSVYFSSGHVYDDSNVRCFGFSVRPVYAE